MLPSVWTGKKVAILGLARQGKSLARFFAEQGARIVISDLRSEESLAAAIEELSGLKVEYALGEHPLQLLDEADLLCLSGGVPADLPIVDAARELGIVVSNDAQLFLEASPAPVLGITGSAGKTTTTVLLGRMAEAHTAGSGRKVWVGGNIENPLLDDLDQIQPDDVVIMELSSFQLELMTRSPQIAAVLNLTPNHLDRHKTMQAYANAKVNILRHQSIADSAVLNHDDEGSWKMRAQVRGGLLSFGQDPPAEGRGSFLRDGAVWLRREGAEVKVCPFDAIELRGGHNRINVAAACSLAEAAGFSIEAMAAGIRGFRGVAHRLEQVRDVQGVKWINDSIATAPERAIASMRAFDEPLILLAGGRDKDLPWDSFAEEVCIRVDHLILFGEAGEKIAKVMEACHEIPATLTIERCADLETAVAAAARIAKPPDVVLLAPGGTSFDAFPDFAARGERFRELVMAL